MFDILPPGVSGNDEPHHQRASPARRRTVASPKLAMATRRRARPETRSALSSNYPREGAPARSRIVHLNWKLPARLRRPVRQQLAKERQLRRRRQQIVRFERRPIQTKPLLVLERSLQANGKTVALPKRRMFNRGAEHHTGDMYRYTQPQLQVAVPPYVGTVAQRATVQTSAPAKPGRSVVRRVSSHVPQSSPRVWTQERDVPFTWQEYETDTPHSSGSVSDKLFTDVGKSVGKTKKSGLILPIVMSVLPYGLVKLLGGDSGAPLRHAVRERRGFAGLVADAPKKKPRVSSLVANLGILFGGCVVAALLVWNLQGVGRGFAALSNVKSTTHTALQEIVLAQSALAQTDFDASTEAFSRAESLLREAKDELNKALAASGHILKVVDITGTVQAGQHVLEAGEALTQAGQRVSRGVAPLVGSDIVADDNGVQDSLTLVEAIYIARDEFQSASQFLREAEQQLSQVESPFLPDEVREQVVTLADSVPRARSLLEGLLQQSDSLLYLLGSERDREYLLLFANNHEIRPIGGFIGTVGLVNVDSGQVESIDVRSVYDPDGQLKEFIAPPHQLLPIVDRWYMRDANWFVDYELSASKIAAFFEKEGGPTVDGVILLTPDVIQRLLDITGPIEVPGYEQTVSSDNFVMVTQEEVTYSYDRELNQPKQFLSDLTPILLNKLFDSDASKLRVLGALGTALERKELVLYVHDDGIQQQLRDLGWSGSFPRGAQGFLHVNNANIGGHKSDQFVDQEIDYRSRIEEDGDVEVIVTIRRSHNGPSEAIDFSYPPGDNPATKDNIVFQRVFVPNEAQLLEAHGFSSISDVPRAKIEKFDVPLVGDPDVVAWQAKQRTHPSGTTVGREAGYTYFANWMITKPGETSVGFYRYRIPRYAKTPDLVNTAERYSVFYAKQPGAVRSSLRVSLSVPDEYRIVHTVPASGITTQEGNEMIYRGDVQRDIIVGAVYERSNS